MVQKQVISANPDDYLYISQIYLDQQGAIHKRKIFNFFDLLGVMGGVLEVIVFIFGFLMFPISEHSFVMIAISRLFLAKTNDETLFQQDVKGFKKKKKLKRM